MHFWFVFDIFTPNTRSRFFTFNVNELHEFSLPLLANFLWVLKVVI